MQSKTRASALLLAIVLLAPVLAAQPKIRSKKPGKSDAAEGVVLGKAGEALDAFMTDRTRFGEEGFCGCVLVAVGDTVLLERGYGIMDANGAKPMRADALWDWASVTKQFTAAAILKLEMQKKLKLTDTLPKIFRQAPKDKAKVTLRHLLDHTSGIQNDARLSGVRDPFDRKDMVREILSLPMVSAPGEKWAYSNIAYFLLAAIIEQVSGKSYEDYVIENLFQPAGMTSACFIGSPGLDMERVPRELRGTGVHFAYGPRLSWGYRGAGAAMASTREMFLWDRALRTKKILSEKALEKLYEPSLNNYALGWFVDRSSGKLRVSHSGAVGNLVTWYLRALEEDAVVALATSTKPTYELHRVAHELLATALTEARRAGLVVR